jgi:hypothetical protein
MAKMVKATGGHPPVYTGKGRKGTGLGYHGKPGKATTPAKGAGYHGVGPKSNRARGLSPKPPMTHGSMVIPHSKPAAHKAGTRRAPGHNT